MKNALLNWSKKEISSPEYLVRDINWHVQLRKFTYYRKTFNMSKERNKITVLKDGNQQTDHAFIFFATGHVWREPKRIYKKTIDIRSGRRVDNMIGILIDLLGKLYAVGMGWGWGWGRTPSEYRYEPWLYLNKVFVQEMRSIPAVIKKIWRTLLVILYSYFSIYIGHLRYFKIQQSYTTYDCNFL